MNVPLAKHVEIELVSILALMMIHVVQLPSAVWQTTKQNVVVLQEWLETLILYVYQVRNSFAYTSLDFLQISTYLHIFTILVKQGECQHDVECPDNKACIDYQCLDPCILNDPCGKNAECETRAHRPVCLCPSGWVGDPHTECYTCRLKIRLRQLKNTNYYFSSHRWMPGRQRLSSWQSLQITGMCRSMLDN